MRIIKFACVMVLTIVAISFVPNISSFAEATVVPVEGGSGYKVRQVM